MAMFKEHFGDGREAFKGREGFEGRVWEEEEYMHRGPARTSQEEEREERRMWRERENMFERDNFSELVEELAWRVEREDLRGLEDELAWKDDMFLKELEEELTWR